MKSDSTKTIQESKTSGVIEMASKESNAIQVTPVVATPVTAATAPVISTDTANQPSALTASANTTTVSDGIVAFKASGDTWIEVKDAKGATVFKQLMKAGGKRWCEWCFTFVRDCRKYKFHTSTGSRSG